MKKFTFLAASVAAQQDFTLPDITKISTTILISETENYRQTLEHYVEENKLYFMGVLKNKKEDFSEFPAQQFVSQVYFIVDESIDLKRGSPDTWRETQMFTYVPNPQEDVEWEGTLPLSYAQRGLIDGEPYNCPARDIKDGMWNEGCPWEVLVDKCNVFDDTFYVGASRPLDAQYVLKDGQTIQVGGGYTISSVEEYD